MDFGSDYVYMYEEPTFEYISDEEYEAGMNISDSDSDDDDDVPPPHPPPPVPGNVASDSAIKSCLFAKPFTEEVYDDAVPPPPPPAPGNVASDSAIESCLFAKPFTAAPPDEEVYDCLEESPIPAPRALKSKKRAHHWRSELGGGALPPISGKGQKVRQGDTNIVSVKFNKLIAPSNMHAGDPEYCTGCGAIVSKISKVIMEGEEKVWVCEFCSRRNVVDMEDEEIPVEQDVTFMLEPALSTMASGPSGMDESLVIFCVDVSGSMCVTTEVPGHIELRGAESLRRVRQMNRDRADQYLPRQRRDVTYVSRLQSVQAAIDHQLQEMSKEYPNRRVALVTFSNEVTIIGDGKVDPVSIAGDKLSNKDTLKTIATEQPFPQAIKTTRDELGKKLFDLEECGPTALGPALLVSSTMAAKVRGSKVILCTDGLANIGMGKLDNFKNDTDEEESFAFYEDIGTTAAENGVSISVITIKGTDCKLVQIGKMADKTGGQVNIVDPLKLTQEFSTILASKIIATNVVATFILHKELFFFYEDSEESKVVKSIGNVTADSEISFEYGVRSKQAKTEQKENSSKPKEGTIKEEDETADANKEAGTSKVEADKESEKREPERTAPEGAEGKTEGTVTQGELPFQLQIVYMDTEGAKALRLITQVKPITTDRKKAERLANLDVLAPHTARTSAQMALDGMYTMSRERALMNQRVAWRHSRETSDTAHNKSAYKSKFGKIRSMENYIASRQQVERSESGRTYSDEEDDYACADELPHGSRPRQAQSKLKSKSFLSRLKKKRSETTEDEGAALVYKGKSAKSFFEETD